MRPILAALTVVAILLAPSAPALAQRKPEKPPAAKPDPKLAEAKKLFDDGAESYTQGNYDAAIAAWEKSYELSKRPLIFESIANAYERLGNPRKAREYLNRWREVAPEEEYGILDARLKNLDARVAREEEAEAARKAQEEKEQREREGQAKTAPAPPTFSVPGLALAGAGGGLVLVGLTLDIIATAGRPDPKQVCKSDKDAQICTDAIVSSNTLAIVGDVLWITGVAATATGLALLFTYKPKTTEQASRTTLLPVLTPRSGGLLIQHRF